MLQVNDNLYIDFKLPRVSLTPNSVNTYEYDILATVEPLGNEYSAIPRIIGH